MSSENITLAHYDAVGRGHPCHQQSRVTVLPPAMAMTGQYIAVLACMIGLWPNSHIPLNRGFLSFRTAPSWIKAAGIR
jgi:hypothetical protein